MKIEIPKPPGFYLYYKTGGFAAGPFDSNTHAKKFLKGCGAEFRKAVEIKEVKA